MNKFVDRHKEIERISKCLQIKTGKVIVVYGRRRCGKSTLLRRLIQPDDVYFAADLREKYLQITALAQTIETVIPGFSKVDYPDWESLFLNLNNILKKTITVCLDEFPYLVKNSPELPSVLQKIIDSKENKKYHLILCGSSQQMMHSITLDSTSPLYGRSDEIIKITPMSIAYLKEFLKIGNVSAVKEYGIWGGVPRYWELRKSQSSFEKAVKYHLLNPDGILFEEPERLFLDEMRTSVQTLSVLSLIGMGSHRISEIAGRLKKPVTQLSRLFNLLIDLGYIEREIPFGESAKSSKKSLYKIKDPFMSFYFTFILPNKSRLEFGLIDKVWDEINGQYDSYISHQWENLCRQAVPFLTFNDKQFNPAARWWGSGNDRKAMEIDIMAESIDKTSILIGEVKWTESTSFNKLSEQLQYKSENLPFTSNRKIIKVLFLKKSPKKSDKNTIILTPADIVNAYL